MFDFLYSPCVVLTVFLTELEKRKQVCVCATCSCMDTSSKAWLPHQSQFGLVGQAEVCCGGPGVNLTPSEWADLTPPPQSVLAPSDLCFLYICFSMSSPPPPPQSMPVHVPAVSVTKSLLFPNAHPCLRCTISLFLPWLLCPSTDTMKLYRTASTYPGFFIFRHSVLQRSVAHPLSPALSHSQSFIWTSPGFDGTICLPLQL